MRGYKSTLNWKIKDLILCHVCHGYKTMFRYTENILRTYRCNNCLGTGYVRKNRCPCKCSIKMEKK